MSLLVRQLIVSFPINREQSLVNPRFILWSLSFELTVIIENLSKL